ncbi:hypothetical protein L596_026683 [Steinernema carpocapsae]|uniref:Uncharacterized protein n=1 Tax=Steinernema carpocapsae TaxID=34508 RepID=A0A4V6XVP8_STECR|nr:hypothetical protein L596_026683 [Steinernema carpocapsae]
MESLSQSRCEERDNVRQEEPLRITSCVSDINGYFYVAFHPSGVMHDFIKVTFVSGVLDTDTSDQQISDTNANCLVGVQDKWLLQQICLSLKLKVISCVSYAKTG